MKRLRPLDVTHVIIRNTAYLVEQANNVRFEYTEINIRAFNHHPDTCREVFEAWWKMGAKDSEPFLKLGVVSAPDGSSHSLYEVTFDTSVLDSRKRVDNVNSLDVVFVQGFDGYKATANRIDPARNYVAWVLVTKVMNDAKGTYLYWVRRELTSEEMDAVVACNMHEQMKWCPALPPAPPLDAAITCTGCQFGVEMCENRPCWGTPDQILYLLEQGTPAQNFWLDWWEADGVFDHTVHIVAPRNIRETHMNAPQNPQGHACVFLSEDKKCKLHDICKPAEGAHACCRRRSGEMIDFRVKLVREWDTELGRRVVQAWKEQFNAESGGEWSEWLD